MNDRVPDIHRRAQADYRAALGMDLRNRRTAADLSIRQLRARTGIPAETIRSYESGATLPQLVRLANLAPVFGATLLDLLESTATYVYRASGQGTPRRADLSSDRLALRAVILYCGVTPEQLDAVEAQLTP